MSEIAFSALEEALLQRLRTGAQLDFDAVRKCLAEQGIENKWKELETRVTRALSKNKSARKVALAALGLQPDKPDELTEAKELIFTANTFSAQFKKQNRGRNPKLQAIQIAAGLFGDSLGEWASVFLSGEPVSVPRPAPAPTPTGPVRLAVLRSRDIAYTQDIYVGFLCELAKLFGGADKVHLVADRAAEVVPGDSNNHSQILEADARSVIARAQDQSAQYLVAIGTQAAQALKTNLGEQFGKNPKCSFLFLGVTYPIDAGLVGMLGLAEKQQRNEEGHVGGVGYGRELSGIASHLQSVWPEAQIRFVYRKGAEQDHQASMVLSKVTNNRFKIVSYDDYPTKADLDALEDAILFSWHTFESMFENPGLRGALAGRRIVATTRRNVECGYAAVGYSADDFDIGAIGAKILHNNFIEPEKQRLGLQNVGDPDYKWWVNLPCCRKLADVWTIPDEVMKQATLFDATDQAV